MQSKFKRTLHTKMKGLDMNPRLTTMGSTGAAEADFVWFHAMLRGGPVNTIVGPLDIE